MSSTNEEDLPRLNRTNCLRTLLHYSGWMALTGPLASLWFKQYKVILDFLGTNQSIHTCGYAVPF
jgi:hypothetical protein